MKKSFKNQIVIGRPFVDHVDQNKKPELQVSFLDKAYTMFYTNNINLLNYGVYKEMGYLYDFRPFLNSYIYKQHGQWQEAYAPNKTLLRKVIYGRIDKIIQQ